MRTEIRALGAVVRNAELRRLHLAWLFTSIGDWGGALALSLYAYERGGATGAGVMALLRALPGAPTAPFLAAVVDRVSRRRVMIASSVARALLLGAIAAAVAADAPIGFIYVEVVLLAAVGPAFRPAFVALVPRFARTPAELTSANVAASAVHNLGFLLGALAAGLLFAATSGQVALAAIGLGFALAILPLLAVERDPAPESEPDARPFAEISAGFREVRGDAGLRALVVLAALLCFVDGALDVLIVVAAIDLLDAGPSGAGVLTSSWGIGCTVGGAAVLVLLSRSRLTRGVSLGALVFGAAIVLMGVTASVGVAIAALVVFGIGYTLVEVAITTLQQRVVPDHLLGRIAGVSETSMVSALALGSLFGGLAAEHLGGRGALIAIGIGAPAVVLLVSARLHGLESDTTVTEREYQLLRSHSIFAPLSIADAERLAGALVEVAVAPGEELILEGGYGDRFYLVAEGQLDVFVGDEFRRTCGPGDGIGEIALIRDVPRTATVQAKSQALLFALERSAFLAAVTHSRSARAAHRVADSREPVAG